MHRSIIWGVSNGLLFIIAGCETVQGVTNDVAITARNVGDILRVGHDIDDITR